MCKNYQQSMQYLKHENVIQNYIATQLSLIGDGLCPNIPYKYLYKFSFDSIFQKPRLTSIFRIPYNTHISIPRFTYTYMSVCGLFLSP